MTQADLESLDAAAARHHAGAAAWVYRGVWAWLVKWLRTLHAPPTLPAHVGQFHRSFQPSPGFLRYLKFGFWFGMIVLYGVLLGAWVMFLFVAPRVGLIATAPLWLLLIAHVSIAYVSLYLRYDTTWYVLTDRSLRVRRGVWTIHEITITFENVQHVRVKEGPLQRWFGIADVEVQTAGGGMVVGNQQAGAAVAAGHVGLIEGVSNAQEIRDLVLSQLQKSQTAGLGDETHMRTKVEGDDAGSARFTRKHLALLLQIRDELVARED